MMVGAEKPGTGGELLLGQSSRPKYSLFPKGEGSDAPAWVAFDKQVLCFDAYFQETVPQRREEKYRVRTCKIYFYLEDDTIQVVEPELKNSGIPQDCDPFTRNVLMKMGVRLNPPSSMPADPYTNHRQEMEENMKPLRPYEIIDTLKQFLEHDRKVLRFSCYWDDTESMFGDPRELILHYFLADDTMEIYEFVLPNSGRDTVPKFLHRVKLPKHAPIPKYQPGEITDRTVLNVFGPVGQGGRYILDSLKTGAVEEEFYKDCDLTIGGVINVWGRRLIICDCDNFTKEYYRSKYGIEDFTPVSYKASPPSKTARQVPPYTGFGSEEDSLCSCQGLLLKPPQKDFRKLMEKDGQGLVSNVLRFVAKMLTDSSIDKERVFIIYVYLSDDTIAVFEPPQRNSGVIGGTFLKRGRVKKPGQELYKSEVSEYFTAQDLYVGARLDLNNQPFQLLDADEFTFDYMEQHADEFPKANIDTIISKVKSISEEEKKKVKQFFTMSGPSSTGFIPYESFRTLLAEMDIHLSEHEIITLGRTYSVREQSEVDLDLMLAVVQDQLKKKNFEKFTEMIRAFTHEDRHRSGHLSSKEAQIILKALRLPLSDDLLRALLEKFQDESEKIDYHAFLSGINWRENPAPAVPPDVTVKFDTDWREKAADPAVKTINCSLFLEDVFGSTTNINES
ncbi:EF-hand domain-containing family member C2-like [Sinocyclocheilus rhinocerous]|uniref:EF-hand domain-containing family member C2-like n=1 Tax=Sinocyclocheilus rhinocerous TaxID=307959 RepID=UPI0007B86A4A|nr:PREDICTED: EF-hand domain-containing family member C2-like [Sinocyclocheilus rhinocerous]